MKKFNLIKEIIKTDKYKLSKAIASNKIFAINIYGNILYEPFGNDEILIYKDKAQDNIISKSLGKNYQVVEDDDIVLIKAFSNWQEIISINIKNSSYDDTTADGVAEFSDTNLENIGWYATEFDIDYRTIVEAIEKKCDGVLLCIEQDEPYQFSGMGFIKNNQETYEFVFEFCQNIIKEKMQTDSYFQIDKLTEDEKEAAKFFKVIQ